MTFTRPTAPRAIAGALLLSVLVLITAQRAPVLAQPSASPLALIAGTWSASDWGTIELRPDGTGSYTSTYGTGPGRMTLRPIGQRRFTGTWGESSQRHGTLTLELSADGRTLTGTWTPDASCTIGEMTGGTLAWTRG